MERTTWKPDADGSFVKLDADGLQGTIDVQRPDRGLSDLTVLGRELPGWRLFAICVPSVSGRGDRPRMPCAGSPPERAGLRLIDCYARGTDLIAAFRVDAPQPFDLTVCWRVVHDPSRQAVGLDVIPAVNTELLDSRPELVLWSRGAARSIWQLCGKGVWQELPATGAELREVCLGGDAERQSALLWRKPVAIETARPPHTGRESPAKTGSSSRRDEAEPDRIEPPSYVEMVSSHDWPSIMYRSQPNRHEVWHRLFTMPLEKGVILRTRLRGLFFPTAADALRHGWESYRSLLTEPPPLTV